MLLQRNTEINDEDKNMDDEEDNALISHSYVRLLCEKILRFSLYLSVESLRYASVILTKKKGKEKMTNSVAKLMMRVCVFLFDFYDIVILELL